MGCANVQSNANPKKWHMIKWHDSCIAKSLTMPSDMTSFTLMTITVPKDIIYNDGLHDTPPLFFMALTLLRLHNS